MSSKFFPSSLWILSTLVLTATIYAWAGDSVPEGYKLVAKKDFESADALKGWVMTDPEAWKISATDDQHGNHALELFGKSKYEYVVRSPFNIALMGDVKVGDFVLEADLRQTGREYGHRDLCLFFGFQDPSHFYYVHIASAADPHAHNIFIVNNEPRTAIATETTKGVEWGETVHKVRLERKVGEGSIKVFYDDMSKPIMIATDKTFGEGFVGVGSFDDTGKFDNLRLWSPKSTEAKIGFFKAKE